MDTLIVDLPSLEEAEIAERYGRKVGAGAFRKVFRVPGSKWVYKREHDRDYGNGCNALEYRNFRNRRASLPNGVDFPEMHLLEDGTIAAEYIDGTFAHDLRCYTGCTQCRTLGLSACWQEMVSPARASGYKMNDGMQDLHDGNVIIADSKVYIIDIGEHGDEQY